MCNFSIHVHVDMATFTHLGHMLWPSRPDKTCPKGVQPSKACKKSSAAIKGLQEIFSVKFEAALFHTAEIPGYNIVALLQTPLHFGHAYRRYGS